jgi:hypothetical protein
MVGFVISGAEPSVSATTVFVNLLQLFYLRCYSANLCFFTSKLSNIIYIVCLCESPESYVTLQLTLFYLLAYLLTYLLTYVRIGST